MSFYMHIVLCPLLFFFFNDTATTEIYTLSLHDALPIFVSVIGIHRVVDRGDVDDVTVAVADGDMANDQRLRSEEHTSELQSRLHLVCRLLLEKKKNTTRTKLTTGSKALSRPYVARVL